MTKVYKNAWEKSIVAVRFSVLKLLCLLSNQIISNQIWHAIHGKIRCLLNLFMWRHRACPKWNLQQCTDALGRTDWIADSMLISKSTTASCGEKHKMYCCTVGLYRVQHMHVCGRGFVWQQTAARISQRTLHPFGAGHQRDVMSVEISVDSVQLVEDNF